MFNVGGPKKDRLLEFEEKLKELSGFTSFLW